MDETAKQEETQEDSGLQLNFEVLQQQGKTITYLGDLYGYQVFSEEFEKSIEKQKRGQNEELENSFINILTNEPKPIADNAFQMVISGEKQVVIKAEYNTNSGKTDVWTMAGCVLLGMILTAGIWLYIERKRKEKSSRANNSNDYRTYYE
ncbi:MAG: hypothetical protein NC086_05915 [Alistipes sp.]|nr:hypothetical protein [Alistipes sp.]